jgi:TRAP-type C4-dicarboxylate transport system permease small subunit
MKTTAPVIRRIVELWALAGGFLLIAIVMLNVVSLIGNIVANQPVRGDFELVEMGVAVAVFAFLPYCQLTGANVTADIFTAWAGPRLLTVLAFIAAVVALGFAVLLLWSMWYGLLDLREYREVTTIYQIPVWGAFVPILISLVLLTLACLLTLIDTVRPRPAESEATSLPDGHL